MIAIFALALIVLMVFAAFAIDLGLVYNERRQDQSAADASALSGGVVALNGGSIQAVVNEVLAKVSSDVGRTVSNTQWTSCTDSQNLSVTSTDGHTAQSLSLTPATQCISWTANFDEMRVRIPNQSVGTHFARVIGINNVTTSAFAHIEFVYMPGGGGSLPFVALSSAGAGQHICLRTSSSGDPPPQMIGNGPGNPASPGLPVVNADPCDSVVYDPASSTFGTLTPADYLGGCDTQNENVRAAIMVGVDHPTGFFGDPTDNNPPPFTYGATGTASSAETARQTTYGDVRIDGPTTGPASSTCTTMMPNTIKMNSGLSASDLRCATISDAGTTCDGLTPRLRQVTTLPSVDLFLGERFDNTPPWAYIASSSSLPQDCVDVRNAYTSNNTTWDFYDRQEEFLRCLTAWTAARVANPSLPDLFTSDIGSSPRFAYVPQIAERRLCNNQDLTANCNPALDYAHINSYVPVFLYRLYANNGTHTDACDSLDPRPHRWAMHEPGQTPGVGTFESDCGGTHNTTKVDRLSALVLDCRSLPTEVCDESRLPGVPGNPGSVSTVFDLELSR